MRIIEAPQYGPMFRFSDANVYWALHLLSDGKRIGRRRLAEAIGVGEGSMRRILETLREWEMVSVRQTGIVITRSGLGFLSELPLKVLDLDLSGSVVGEHSQAVMVLGAADKIENGMQQRDAGIKVGASGCTTVIYRDGALMIPPDWNLDEEDPRLAKAIRALGMTERDVIIAGGGPTRASAVSAALTAAFELFRNLCDEPPFRPAGAGRNGRNVYAFLSGWCPSLREASEMAHDAMRLLLSAALLAALAGFFAAAPALFGGGGGDGLPEECPGSDLTGTEGGAFNALGADAGGALQPGAEFEESGLKYKVMLKGGAVSCIGSVDKKTMTEAVIPSEIVHSGTEYSVQRIGRDAFRYCGALKSVTIGDGVQKIGECAFYCCDALGSVSIGDGVQKIGDGAFCSCDALGSVTIGDGVETIGDHAFYGCEALKDLTFKGGSPPELRNYCLSLGWKNHDDTIHPATCTVHSSIYSDENPIPARAADQYTTFIYDYTAPPINLGSDSVSVVIFGCYVYTGDVQHVSYAVSANGALVPAGELEVASGGSGTGAGVYYLVVKAQESSVACVGRTAPVKWTIEPRPLADSMIGVSGKYMYNGTEQSVSFEVRDRGAALVEGRDYEVASGASGVGAGNYTLTVEGAGNYCGSIFAGWSIALPETAVSVRMQYSESDDGTLRCEGVEGPVRDVKVPETAAGPDGTERTVASIAPGAFAGNAAIETAELPGTLAEVPAGAFAGCTGLREVCIGDGVSAIGESAFEGCASLEEVRIPSSVRSVSASAFSGCPSLRSVVLSGGFAEAAMSVLAREWRLPGQEARTVERIAVEGAVDLSDVAALDSRELVILSDGTSGGVFYGDDGETLLEGAGRALGGSRPFVPYPDAPEPNAWRAVSVGSEDGSSDVIAAAAAVALLAVAAAVLWIRRR